MCSTAATRGSKSSLLRLTVSSKLQSNHQRKRIFRVLFLPFDLLPHQSFLGLSLPLLPSSSAPVFSCYLVLSSPNSSPLCKGVHRWRSDHHSIFLSSTSAVFFFASTPVTRRTSTSQFASSVCLSLAIVCPSGLIQSAVLQVSLFLPVSISPASPQPDLVTTVRPVAPGVRVRVFFISLRIYPKSTTTTTILIEEPAIWWHLKPWSSLSSLANEHRIRYLVVLAPL